MPDPSCRALPMNGSDIRSNPSTGMSTLHATIELDPEIDPVVRRRLFREILILRFILSRHERLRVEDFRDEFDDIVLVEVRRQTFDLDIQGGGKEEGLAEAEKVDV